MIVWRALLQMLFFQVDRMKLIGKIAGKQRKGQTIFGVKLMIEDFDSHNSFDRTFLTSSTNASAFVNVISASSGKAWYSAV